MEPARWDLEYTQGGYLLIPVDVAADHFPQDTLVAILKDDELWLMPTRGDAAGGLCLKQRNPAGDRALLLLPFLPENTLAGSWPAIWDQNAGALKVAYKHLQPAIGAAAVVKCESGRWVVYLELGFWERTEPGVPVKTELRRIADYSTEQDALVAARWIERASDRTLQRAPMGF